MEKIINIGDKEVKLSNNVGWTMEYRDQYGTDIIPVILPLAQSMTEALAGVLSECGTSGLTVENIAEAVRGQSLDIMAPLMQASMTDLVIGITWAMAKDANETIDPPRKWVKQFDSFPLDEIVPELIGLIKTGFMSSKNSDRLGRMLAEIKNTGQSASTKSSSQGSSGA